MASLIDKLKKNELNAAKNSKTDEKSSKTSLINKLRKTESSVNADGASASSAVSKIEGNSTSLVDKIRSYREAEAFNLSDATRVNSAKNSGSGAEYTAKKLGLGVVQSIEGIFDYTLGTVASVFGADAFAERQFARDWIDYSAADEEYNPGEGWKFVGDVGGGLGTTLPTMAVGAVVTFATGGLAPALAATLVATAGFATAGLSAAGVATKEAYQETGELGASELKYGALSGLVEGGVEVLTGAVGVGATSAGKSIAKAFGSETAKKTTKAVAKTLTKRVATTAAKEFVSEAVEEGFSEWISPQLKRVTYDPSAKDATDQEIVYAAIVGGVSGLMTKGVGTGIVHSVNLGKGASVVNSGRVENVLTLSDTVLEATGSTSETAARVRELRNSLKEGKLKIVEGKKVTAAQQRALGELESANMLLLFEDSMQAAAKSALANAEAVAERLNQYGTIKMVNGKMTVVLEGSTVEGDAKDITAEDIRAGYDEKKELRSALESNDLLRYVAASDVAGRLIMSVDQFEKTALEGTTIKNQVDLNNFIEKASPEKRAALGKELGIADNEWDTLQLGRFNEALAEYRESGRADAYRGRIEAIERAKAIPENDAKVFPEEVVIGDGEVERYRKDGADVAVYREGENYMIYDYASGDVSRFLTRDEMKKALREIAEADMKDALRDIGVDIDETTQDEPIETPIDVSAEPLPNLDNVKGKSLVAKLKAAEQKKNASTGEVAGGKNAENASAGDEAISRDARMSKSGEGTAQGDLKAKIDDLREKIDAEKIDTELREKVKDYEKLSAPNRSMIRKIVREGRVHGLSEADVLSYARVAAHTGLNIEYDANMRDGDAGYFDPENNRIVVNPKTTKKQELILIHELDHAVRKLVDLGGNVHTLVYEGAEKGLSEETWEQIKADYAEQDVDVTREELLADEASAYYTEAILGGKITVDMLLGKNGPSGTPVPTMKKILDFFTGAARAYSKDEKLSRAARRHYKSFKAMFDAFAKANQGRNAETAVEGDNGKLTVESEKSARQSKNVEAKLAEYKKPITHNDISTLRSIGRKSINEFTSADIDAAGKWAYKFYDEMKEKSPFFRAWFGDWRAYDTKTKIPIVPVNAEAISRSEVPRGDFNNEDTGWSITSNADGIDETSNKEKKQSDSYHALKDINALIKNAVLLDTVVATEPSKRLGKDAAFVHHLYCPVSINGKVGVAKLYIAESLGDKHKFYLMRIEKASTAMGFNTENDVSTPRSKAASVDATVSISQIYEFVKAHDKDFEKNSDQRIPFSPKPVNELLLDENKQPKVFYHGTNAEFWTFEKGHKRTRRRLNLGDGFYFGAKKSRAEAYVESSNGKVMEVYVNIKKPYEVIGPSFTEFEMDDIRSKLSAEDRAKLNYDNVNEYLEKLGYDGIIGYDYSGTKKSIDQVVAFKPEQIKSATDNIGTFDGESKDIRYAKEIKPELAEGGKVESVMGRDARVGAKRASAFSRRRTEMTKGQLQQMIARYTGEKVYTSKEARETIDNIAGIFTLSQKNRAKLYEAMWQGYNACKTDNERAEFSYDMAEYVTMMLLTESSVENPDRAGTMETLSKLKSGIGHLTFNDSQRADLRHALDKTGYKRFIGRWGFRETMQPNRRRVALDVFLHNLGEENPEFAYLKDMTPQDAIIELDRIYERTIEDSKAVIGLLDDVPDSELRYMIDDLGTAIYESFSTKGEKSTVEKIIEARLSSTERKYAKLKNKYDELERKYIEEQGRPRKLLNLSYQIQKMKNLQLGTFLNSTDYNNEVFKQTLEILGSIEFRGNISPAKVRTAMKRLAEWYTSENPVLAEMPGEPGSKLYSDWIALQINAIAEGNGGLTNFELDQLDIILQHATKIVENFNRVWKGGKWVNAETTAKSYIGVAEEASLIRINSGSYRKVRKMLDNLSRKYFLSFGDPMSVFRYMDGYMPGFYTEMGEELRQGAFRYQVDMMEMKTEYDKFLKGNKKYLKDASTEALEYAGVKMTKLQFMSLYMTMQRQQAVRGLAENGFSLIDVSGRRVEADGFLERVQKRLGTEAGIEKNPDGTWKVSAEQLEAATKGEIAEMKKKLSKTDLEFIGVIESTLNGRCKDLKKMRDMERLGFSNTIEGYYYPIVRAMIAKNIDTKGMWGEIDRASNISANKDTVKGAKGALWIESADTVFNRHIDAVARYAELSPVIDSINKIFNLDVSGNKNRPRSVRTATFNAWQTDKIFGGAVADGQKHGGEAYLKELLADVQGIGKDVGIGDKFVNGIRGKFAIAALSANPKVLATQFSSVFASTSIISMKDITAGSKLAFDKNADSDVDKYCPIAKLRNYDSSAAKAQGVIDNISGVGEKLMAGVGFMDRQVVKTVWGGAQANIERTMGLKIGTEENKIEAGKLLEKIIFETQQNSVATEKSSAMRSKSAFMKTLTMFTSDAMKNVGRVIDGLGMVSALKQRIKNAKAKGDSATVSELQAELKEANDQSRAAIGALAMNAVYMTLIARLFSHLYAKEDEEEGWKPLAFISETFGNMLGGLPVFSDLYDFFTNGYEISDSVYDTINDVLVGTKKVASVAADVMDGTATSADVNSAAMSFTQNLCTVLGLPMRNARNLIMGLIRRFNPNAAYKMEMLTKNKNLASDFAAAVEAGDDSKASMILGLLLSERLGEDAERTVGDAGPYESEILRMSKLGYNVLPRTIGDSVTIGGEEIIMYPEEQTALRARYSEAVGVIETLIASEAYAALSDEQKESAVRFVYDVHYDQGIYELYGYERNMKRRLFAKVLSSDKLALAAAMTAGLESDYEDEKGKAVSEDKWAAIRGTTARVNYSAVSGSKRKKVIAAINKLPLTTAEKLLIIAYKGYTIKDGDIRGVSAERAKQMLSRYARGQGLSKDEAKALEGYL